MNIHYTDKYLMSPTHPVSIILVGCGGTGSHVLKALADMNCTLQALGKPGLHVTVYDDDIVTETNVGRQNFYECDLNRNKAIVLVSRINRSYGTAWEAVDKRFYGNTKGSANIIVSCVDTIKARLDIAEKIEKLKKTPNLNDYEHPFYWIDFGNKKDIGQVIIGTIRKIEQPKSKFKTVNSIPLLTQRFELSAEDDKNSGPSCSHREALNHQDLYINSSLAVLGCDIIWRILRDFKLDKAGLYLNLKTSNLNPIPL